MRLINRKAGVVIGLTVILTFPVTVVSGAGSQKKGETVRTTYTVPADRTGNGDKGGPSLIQVPADHVGTSSGAVTVYVHSPASPDRAHNQ